MNESKTVCFNFNEKKENKNSEINVTLKFRITRGLVLNLTGMDVIRNILPLFYTEVKLLPVIVLNTYIDFKSLPNELKDNARMILSKFNFNFQDTIAMESEPYITFAPSISSKLSIAMPLRLFLSSCIETVSFGLEAPIILPEHMEGI